MRFYLIVFFFAGCFLTGCGNKDIHQGIPDNVLKEHDMAELLTDIHLADGSLYNVPPMPDSLAKHGTALYAAVFKLHHTDTALFKRSLKFYSTRPELISEIYEGVLKRLQHKTDSLAKIKVKPDPAVVKPQLTPDSLKKIRLKQRLDSIKKVKALNRINLRIKKQARRDFLKKLRSKHKPATLNNKGAI